MFGIRPKAADTVTVTSTSTALSALISGGVAAGTGRMRIQNLDASNTIYWTYNGTAVTTGSSALIKPLEWSPPLYWEKKFLDLIQFIAGGNTKMYVVQEGIG